MPTVPRPKNHLDSFRYAVEGIVHVFRTQRHMRFHFAILALALLMGIFFGFSSVKMAILFLLVSSVIVAEMFNTAIESVVDMVTQAYHPLAKLAKDIAAGAVLITAICAVFGGLILLFGNHQVNLLHVRIQNDPRPLRVVMAAVTLLLLIVVVGKALGGKGSLLYGGAVSGHAALAFFLAATLVYRSFDLFTGIIAFILAALVAQSRVEGKVHTLQEVVIGGLLGILLTGGAYMIRFLP